MAQNTTLKTARVLRATPAELSGIIGERFAQAVVVETSKPAAARALGVTLHWFNKEVAWEPTTDEIAAQVPGTVIYRAASADEADDSLSWWYLTDEKIPVEIPWGQFAEDEDEADDTHEYDTVMDTEHPEGPQVMFASRHLTLEDELADTVDRLELAIENGENLDTVRSKRSFAQYTDDGTRDFEDELDMGMDAEDVAAVVEHLGEVREALPKPDTAGVIVLDAKQTATLREREAAAAELTAMDDRALAAKIMARLNSQDPDDARKVIDMGGVQSQMWMAAAQIAREHFNA